VLDQRSEVEKFFHDAFAKVRDEIKAERTAQKLSGEYVAPSISDSIRRHAEQERPFTIDEMSWDQKEKLLRVMFHKINKGEPGSRNNRVAVS
jgi:hypothetical protein